MSTRKFIASNSENKKKIRRKTRPNSKRTLRRRILRKGYLHKLKYYYHLYTNTRPLGSLPPLFIIQEFNWEKWSWERTAFFKKSGSKALNFTSRIRNKGWAKPSINKISLTYSIFGSSNKQLTLANFPGCWLELNVMVHDSISKAFSQRASARAHCSWTNSVSILTGFSTDKICSASLTLAFTKLTSFLKTPVILLSIIIRAISAPTSISNARSV